MNDSIIDRNNSIGDKSINAIGDQSNDPIIEYSIVHQNDWSIIDIMF